MKERKFKSKSSKYGYIFGNICMVLGLVSFICSLVFICNDYGDVILNNKAIFISAISILMYKYGNYRTGGV